MDTMIELTAMRRSAELAPNTADADSRTVEVVWSAGARVRLGRVLVAAPCRPFTRYLLNSVIVTAATVIVRHHHERFDGKGYPDGLIGEAIPLAARIFALVDVFDALTSVRPYKPALSLEETLSIMEREDGQHFDPKIHAVFRQVAARRRRGAARPRRPSA